MRESCDQALLLRRIPFRESSLVLHLLTRDHGRITLIAKGARRASNRLRPHLTQLTPLSVRWVGGRRGMGTLTDINRTCDLLPPSHHLEGLALLAMAAKLFRDGDHHGFREVHMALRCLAQFDQANIGSIAAHWLLLQQAGVASTLNHCWHCSANDTPLRWHEGRALCQRCNPAQSGDTIPPMLHHLTSGHPCDPMATWDAATIHLGETMIAQLRQQLRHQGEAP